MKVLKISSPEISFSINLNGRTYAHRFVSKRTENKKIFFQAVGEKEFQNKSFRDIIHSNIPPENIVGKVTHIQQQSAWIPVNTIKTSQWKARTGRAFVVLADLKTRLIQIVISGFQNLQNQKWYRHLVKIRNPKKITFWIGAPALQNLDENSHFFSYQKLGDFLKIPKRDIRLHLIAKKGKRVLGNVLINLEDKSCRLSNLTVKIPHRGRGIGTKLFEQVSMICQTLKVNRIEVPLAASNTLGVQFLKKFHFDFQENISEAGIDQKDPKRFFSRLRIIDTILLRYCQGDVLEIGCGEGRFLKKIQKIDSVKSIKGIELDSGFANNAVQANFDVICGEAEKLPYENAAFDVVTGANGALKGMDLERVLPEVSRVLKPGGIFTFDAYNRKPLEKRVKVAFNRIFLKREDRSLDILEGGIENLDKFIRLSENSGFEIITLGTLVPLPFKPYGFFLKGKAFCQLHTHLIGILKKKS